MLPADVFINAPWSECGQQDILILGRAYLPRTDAGYEGTLLHAEDLDEKVCDSLCGMDVCIEHAQDCAVGRVLHAYLTPINKYLMVFLLVTADEVCNTLLPAKLSRRADGSRFYNDLSMAHLVSFVREAGGRVRVADKTPCEVSIVCKGDNEGTFIFDWWFVPPGASELELRTSLIPALVERFAWVDLVDASGADHSNDGRRYHQHE